MKFITKRFQVIIKLFHVAIKPIIRLPIFFQIKHTVFKLCQIYCLIINKALISKTQFVNY